MTISYNAVTINIFTCDQGFRLGPRRAQIRIISSCSASRMICNRSARQRLEIE
jgi:hypothetical protein